MAQPIFRSTDASAPVLSNAVGTLVGVLDACLVNGYGAVSPLGWTIKYTATNKRVYKMPAGSGFELRVDDTTNIYDANVRAAESWSDIDTIGTNGFPSVAQVAGGMYWQKTNNTVGDRPWVLIGDDKRFFFLSHVNTTPQPNVGFFGDIFSYKAGDLYPCMIVGKVASAANANDDRFGILTGSGPFGSVSTGHYMARSYTGVGSSIQVCKFCDGRMGNLQAIGSGGTGNILPYPDPISGAIHVSRIWVGEPTPTFSPRGYIPGIWSPCHDRTVMQTAGVGNGDLFSGTDGLLSRDFEYRYAYMTSSPSGIVLELSDWPES